MRVDVVYALPDRQDCVAVELTNGASAADAVRASGLLARHPELAKRALQLGVFGRRVALTCRLQDGDRVELYRPLPEDPREARRARARRRTED